MISLINYVLRRKKYIAIAVLCILLIMFHQGRQTNGYSRITGFYFCSILNDARFNFSLDGLLEQVNQKQQTFTQMIDTAAFAYYDHLKNGKYDQEALRRFSCYTAVTGRSDHMALSDDPRMPLFLMM